MYSDRVRDSKHPAAQKKIAGVCVQLGTHFDLPVWLVRLLVVLLALKFTWPCIIGYGIGWLCMSNKK
ncbi:PspC domain-containing protein [Pseudoalteromonas obscura]|uniref:PspC domain-containing protein n=1 Tax=Pseudoalteromonas obscura TaxID=3048491 RepID=A0ABT7EQY2_9GAMM|nr:PspC domain-containing protein [Pseudoalteromonas sp. P94(2023)]MDK2597457.1 PspC domain-containing protein [Pseudoalteromonas sp. P94(2023)]